MKKLSQDALIKVRDILRQLVDEAANVDAGVIATSDGLCVVASDSEKEKTEKLAAMASSLCALGEAVVVEVSQGECLSVTVEADNTKIFVLRLTQAPALTLMLVSNKKALVGEIVYAARRYSEKIREVFDLES
jgi:predicted regulator of Ras-like GTPase activity (Roadblock/LC7/MglB family)